MEAPDPRSRGARRRRPLARIKIQDIDAIMKKEMRYSRGLSARATAARLERGAPNEPSLFSPPYPVRPALVGLEDIYNIYVEPTGLVRRYYHGRVKMDSWKSSGGSSSTLLAM